MRRHESNYLRELYQVPGVAATVRLDHIVTSYYSSERVNPNGIVPLVPALDSRCRMIAAAWQQARRWGAPRRDAVRRQ